MIVIMTVWHSGTHSLVDYLGLKEVDLYESWLWKHCGRHCYRFVDGNEIHTTLRNPVDVAISWCNLKRELYKPRIQRAWREQWDAWARIAPIATIHPIEELPKKLHQSGNLLGLVEGSELYNEYVSQELIDYANQKIESVI